MKAAVYTRYGPPDVVHVADVAEPVPRDHDVVIAVRAASVNPLDAVMAGKPVSLRVVTGLRGPKATRPGVDVAGEVAATGAQVTRFHPGDQVFGLCVDDPGARGVAAWMHKQGSFAEYACVPEGMLAVKPGGVTFDQAAAAPVAALTALQGLRDKARVRAGQKVLINGAAGGVGTFAVQIAKWLGADVAGVCSTRNADLVRSIGADRVIDYTQQDFTTDGSRYDLIFDCVGNHSLSACRRALTRTGTYLGVGGPGSRWLIGLLAGVARIIVTSPLVSQRLVTFIAKPDLADLDTIAELMATGRVTPVIDRRYGLGDVPEALRYQQARHARGKIIIDPGM